MSCNSVRRGARPAPHEGCDVRLEISDQGGQCDVRLALAEALEESDHSLSLREWGAFLLSLNHEAYGEPSPPPEPCLVEPGTPAKIEAMAERFEQGLSLFHPDDLPIDPVDHAARSTCRLRNGHAEAGSLLDTSVKAPGGKGAA